MIRLLKTLVGLLLVAAVAGGVYYVTAKDGEPSGNRRARGGEGPVPVVAAVARAADVPVYFEGVGSAKARNSVVVKPQVDGKILSIEFREGQDVKKGDIIARIDPVTFQAQLDQAIAKKTLDESQLANAKRDLERYGRLSGNAVAEKTVDTQRALVAQLEATLKSDDAAIDNARAILGYAEVRSPINGRTGIRMIDEGNLVRSGDAGLVVITEVRPISVVFTLPQQQLPDLNRAMAKGKLTVEAMATDGSRKLDTGVLQVVDNQVDATTGTVRLKGEFPNADLQLWPGQFVNVRLLVETLPQVVVVPTPAVQRGPNGPFVYVVGEGDVVKMRPVKVGQQNDKDAVIAEGVSPGDRVVTTGFARLQNDAKVTVSPSDSNGSPSTPAGAAGPPLSSAADPAPGPRAELTPAEAAAPPPVTTGERKGRRGDGQRRQRRNESSVQ